MKKSDRKPFFIDRGYVLYFALRFYSVALLLFVLFGIILFLALNRHLGTDYVHDVMTLSHIQENLPVVLLGTGIFQAFTITVVLFIITLFWAHRVAGPLVRFQKYMQMIKEEAESGDLNFRQNDQLHYLAQAFRLMQLSRKDRSKKFSKYLGEAENILREYEKISDRKDSDSPTDQSSLEALKEAYEKLGKLF